MEVEKFDIPDLMLIKPRVFQDHRGYFIESYNQANFDKALGYKVNFIQDNESESQYGTLRGLHFQTPPFAQAKLVRVVQGKVLDVAVDLRKDSKTYGQSMTFELSAENKHQLFIPRGFGHGFLVMSKSAIFSYKVDNIYARDNDSGIIWNDFDLNIDWKIEEENIILSEKDKNLQTYKEYNLNPKF